jgi:hypothetical protein
MTRPVDISRSKYTVESLLPALRYFAAARNRAVAEELITDNGGAIHSVERVLDILSLRVCYPHLAHQNNLKDCPNAPCSSAAHLARLNGERVEIEHVLPKRAYAQEVCRLLSEGVTDDALLAYVRERFSLVLLTSEERRRLDAFNRTRLSRTRLQDAGIKLKSDCPR